jgi:hypothetical protein
MSAIHLNGNVWTNYPYALVSESCECMVGYTADLGECFCDTKTLTCPAQVRMRVSKLWGIPSCGDDVVNRMMIRVVVTVILVSGDACRASNLLYCFLACFHTMRFGLK